MDQRYFVNDLPDWAGGLSQNIVVAEGEVALQPHFAEACRNRVIKLLLCLKLQEPSLMSHRDPTVYTGSLGVAFALIKLAHRMTSESGQCLMLAEKLLGERDYHPDVSASLLCGKAGLCTVRALLASSRGDQSLLHTAAKELEALGQVALRTNSDEWLYGRVGFLHGCLLLNRACAEQGKVLVAAEVIETVAAAVIASGVGYSTQLHHRSPLMYQWYGQEYLGAAHGLIGILFILLQVPSVLAHSGRITLIKRSLEYLMDMELVVTAADTASSSATRHGEESVEGGNGGGDGQNGENGGSGGGGSGGSRSGGGGSGEATMGYADSPGADYAALLTELYQEHNPEKLTDPAFVANTLLRYRDREDELLEAVRAKYTSE
jgi:uncharacterized membrane protein YgcG